MKAALVTGGAKRIGRAIVTALAEDGWHVFIHYHGSAKEAEDLAAALPSATPVQADLSDMASTQALMAQCAPLCCLVNNAALFQNDSLETLTPENWVRHNAVNCLAPALLSRDMARALPEGEEGSIINMLDNKVLAPNPDYLSYTISKVGLYGLTKALALELAPTIRVNGIAPGVTMQSKDQSAEGFVKSQSLNPLKRGCAPEDIVSAVRFFLATPCVTGQVVALDGGQHLAPPGRDVYFLTE